MEAARNATSGDLPEIVSLAKIAASDVRGQRGGAVFLAREHAGVPDEHGFGAMLGHADHRLVVGSIDEVTVGYAAGEIAVLADRSSLGVITHLFVQPDAREVGVGEVMIEWLLAWFDDKGCSGVDAYALPGNRATKNFFETNGFKARLLTMHRRLGGDT